MPTPKRFLTTNQLRERWGRCSHMFIERRIKLDPLMPKPKRFGDSRIRFFDEAEIEIYERGQIHADDVA